MQKRGQAQQVLIYALTSIMVIVVLFFGYKAIANLIEAGAAGEVVTLKNKLENTIDEGSSYGKRSTLEFSVPLDYKELCFLSIKEDNLIPTSAYAELDEHPLIEESIGGKDNAFLVKLDGGIDPFYVGRIEVWTVNTNTGFACFDIEEGVVKVRIEGRGDRTIIRKTTQGTQSSTSLTQTNGATELENEISNIEFTDDIEEELGLDELEDLEDELNFDI